MQVVTHQRRSMARPALGLGALAAALLLACVEEPPGLRGPSLGGGAGEAAAGGAQNKSGANSAGSFAANDSGGVQNAAGGSEGGAASEGGAGDALPGAAGEPQNGAGGSAGEPDGVQIAAACPFHSPAVPAEGGAGGAGGADPGSTPSITLQLSPFVGGYLADATGRTLYTNGGDLPGDCNTLPQSLCTADCLVSWPVFDAGARVLPPELLDNGFGTIERAEGGYQTTYMGWPLYYYKSDSLLGQMTGQGKGKVWHVAERTLPSIVILKAGAVKYLADEVGRALYVSADDEAGTEQSDPVSRCSGACLQTFEGFHQKNWSSVSSLEPLDFSVFVRHGGGGLQLAYKGMPLYRAATDLKAGDMNGTAVAGFTVALP